MICEVLRSALFRLFGLVNEILSLSANGAKILQVVLKSGIARE